MASFVLIRPVLVLCMYSIYHAMDECPFREFGIAIAAAVIDVIVENNGFLHYSNIHQTIEKQQER